MDDRCDVLIAGASFAGLALARALAHLHGGDIRITVIDRSPEPGNSKGEEGRAVALSAASKRMLDAIGVWPALADAAEPVREIDITDSSLQSGLRPILLNYQNIIGGDEPASFIVPGDAFIAALSKAVSADAGTTVLASSEPADMTAGDFAAEIPLADGRQLSAALVVAADGRKSKLREIAGIKSVGWSYPQTGIVATVAHERSHHGHAIQHFLPAGPFAILPLKGNRSCITWTEDAAEARRILALDDEGFLAEVEQRAAGRLGALTLDGPRRSFPLELNLARSYVAPRLALVGDAAHAVHPIAGQGLNLALRDVAALAEVVADASGVGLDIGSAAVLRRYERWRRSDSTFSAVTFDALNKLFSNDNPLLRAAREAGLGVVDRLPGLKQMFVAEAAGLSGELPRLLRD